MNHSNVPTPWGKSSSGQTLAPGITQYYCPGHGGIKVVKRLNDQIPIGFRNLDGWYEEDCDACIVWYFHHEAIERYMRAHDMPGWSCSADEYFSKFTKQYFYDYLTGSGYYIPAAIRHFGTEYPPEKLDAYGREAIADALARFQRLEQRRFPKSGEMIRLEQPIRFSNGQHYQEFRFVERSQFRTLCGRLVRISSWRKREFTIVPDTTNG